MKKYCLSLALVFLFAVQHNLYAEEKEILLMEIINMEIIVGDSPLDSPEQAPDVPTRPTSFRATIDGTTLVVTKQESAIPSAQAIVANASTGSIVVNQPFTTSITQQIATPGVYALRIHTVGGDLIGQFIVQ